MSEQTVQTKIRLLLKEQSDQGSTLFVIPFTSFRREQPLIRVSTISIPVAFFRCTTAWNNQTVQFFSDLLFLLLLLLS